MQKLIVNLSLVAIIFSISSCSLGFLASKKQHINIEKDSLVKITLNDSLPIIKNGKYEVKRNSGPIQLKIEKDGFKNEYLTLLPSKRTGLYYTSYIGSAFVYGITGGLTTGLWSSVVFGSNVGIISSFILGGAITGTTAGYFTANDERLWDYPKNIDINIPLKPIIKKDSTMKDVYLNKLSIIAEKNNMYNANQSYKKYLKKEQPNYQFKNSNKDIKIENTIFSAEINNILKSNGFIDTSGLALRGSYNENLFLDATITKIKLLNVKHPRLNHNFSKLQLSTIWDVLDIYKNKLFSDTITFESGEITLDDDNTKHELIFKDALEGGLYTLMSTSRFKDVSKITEINQTETIPSLNISRPTKFVSSLQEAVEATTTITTKSGHGSGFIISEDGYIITNYHVVADSSNLEVILNNGTKYKTRVIQYNKDSDLALLKIEKSGLTPFSIIDSESPNLGKDIFVIGTPTAMDLSQTITKGIISSIRNQTNGSKIIQTDASVNRGSSGGPLVDKNGKLLGVVNAKLVGYGVEGISFAIPSTIIVTALKIEFK